MKIIKILLILFFMFSIINCNSKKKLEKKWIHLKNSSNKETEIKIIEELNNEISKLNGHFSLYGITNKDTLNLTINKFDSIKLNHINIIINWNNEKFYGMNWKPIDRNNIYIFFRE